MHRFAFVLGSLALAACSENGYGVAAVVDTGEPQDVTGDATIEDDPADDAEDPAPTQPIAHAGPDLVVPLASTVLLDGSGSYDPGGYDPLTWQWGVISRPPGSSATLTDATAPNPTFVTDLAGEYRFALTVRNSVGLWDDTPDEVIVLAEENAPAEPVANAGPDRAGTVGVSVGLDGGASFDPSGLTPLTYKWNISSRPPGSAATLSSSSVAAPSLLPDVEGSYVVALSVGNSAGVWDATPDQVVVTATRPASIAEPIANAGPDQSVAASSVVLLDGTGSTDPGGLTPLLYQWTLSAKPPGSAAALSSSTAAKPSFTADKAGAYSFDLTVGNTAGKWDSSPDRVVVTVEAPAATEPVANAGADAGAKPLQTVTLDGSLSYDPSGLSIAAWQWTMVSKPSGSTTSLSDTTAQKPKFWADLAGDYTFDLTVRNSAGVWDATPDRVVVTATPADGFYVQLTWDNEMDLDLHVLNGTSGMWRQGDVSWCNMTPEWGASGSLDNPSLDWDSIDGYGPETTTITVPASGTYTVKAHFFGEAGYADCLWGICLPAKATVSVYLGGVLAQTYTRTMYDQGDVWNVASISWPSGAITKNDTLEYTADIECY